MQYINSPWLNIFSLCLGVLGIFMSYYFFKKGKRTKILSYDINLFSVIKNNLSKVKNIKITYDNLPIDTLNLSRVILWNSGNTLINNSDITNEGIISISLCTDSKILNYDMENSFDNDLNISVEEISPNELSVNFEYIPPNEGILINITHTGDDNIDIIGSLKEGGKIRRKKIRRKYLKNSIDFIVVGFFTIILMMLEILSATYPNIDSIEETPIFFIFPVNAVILILFFMFIYFFSRGIFAKKMENNRRKHEKLFHRTPKISK